MTTTRRKFLKLLVGAGAAVLASNILRKTSKSPIKVRAAGGANNSEVRYAMVIDVGACIGCKQCISACIAENNIPDDKQWARIYEMKPGDPFDFYYGNVNYDQTAKERWLLPVQCFQCEHPPCVYVCPVGATYKSNDGIVEIDYDKCVGCRYCMAACPIGARIFNWEIPEPKIPSERRNPEVPIRPQSIVEKCTFCLHRVRKGLKPACVTACPVGAKHFGNIKDPNSEISKLLKSTLYVRLKTELGIEPSVYYINIGNPGSNLIKKRKFKIEMK